MGNCFSHEYQITALLRKLSRNISNPKKFIYILKENIHMLEDGFIAVRCKYDDILHELKQQDSYVLVNKLAIVYDNGYNIQAIYNNYIIDVSPCSDLTNYRAHTCYLSERCDTNTRQLALNLLYSYQKFNIRYYNFSKHEIISY